MLNHNFVIINKSIQNFYAFSISERPVFIIARVSSHVIISNSFFSFNDKATANLMAFLICLPFKTCLDKIP